MDVLNAEQLAYFLKKLDAVQEGDGTLLDNTLVFYGSSNSKTHNNSNYPLILAGGKAMGFKHNQFLRPGANVPLSNVFVTMLDAMGIPHDGFADSTGELAELRA